MRNIISEQQDDLQNLIDEQFEIMHAKLVDRGFERIDGRNRVAMISPDRRIVFKLPLNNSGMLDNYRERRAFVLNIRKKGYVEMAACRIIIPDGDAGVPMLAMQYVEPIRYSNDLPKWVDCVDCAQVGYNRQGRLVAYDL